MSPVFKKMIRRVGINLMLITLLVSLTLLSPESVPAPLKSLLSGIAPVAEAASSRVNGKIAFDSDRTGNDEIFAMNADGSNQVNLSNNPANDNNPAWSPDGKKIAFVSNRDGNDEIYVMNADGSNQTRLTNVNSFPDRAPSWSPDGTKIAFNSRRDGNDEIYVMNSDGTNQTRLTNNSARDLNPAWSPDGTKIAFDSDRNGNFKIFVMNSDGSNTIRLTNPLTNDRQPYFSPDGSKIVFSGETGIGSEIFVMNADGTNRVQLNSPCSDSPAFSPDGTKLTASGTVSGFSGEIFVMNPDGTNPVPLTSNPGFDAHPSWQPGFPPDTVGVWRPSSRQFLLRNSNTAGAPDITITFGATGDQPLAGDFNGDRKDDIGVFRPSTGQFILRFSTVSKACSFCPPVTTFTILTINFGQSGDQGVVGDWNGDGIDTVGVFRSTTSQWFLTNSPNINNSSPSVNITLAPFGTPGDIAVTGDWNGDGKDTIGVWRTSTGQFFLSNSTTAPPAIDFTLTFGGLNGDIPLVGDWNGDGIDTPGVFGFPRNGEVFAGGVGFFLNNSNTVTANDVVFGFGLSGDIPLAGDWDGPPVNQPPNNGINSPGEGSSTVGQTQVFTTACSDPDGWRNIATIDFKIAGSNGNGNGVPLALLAQFDENRNLIRLYDPDLEVWHEGVPGANVVLENRFVQLNLAGTSVQGSGPTGPSVQVRWEMVFKAAAARKGYKQFLRITDDAGLSTDFDRVGSWNVLE